MNPLRRLNLAALACLATSVAAQDMPLSQSPPSLPAPAASHSDSAAGWRGAFANNTRWALDVAERVVLPSNSGKPRSIGALGIDYHKIVTGDHGDIGTLVAQGYLLRFDAEDTHDWDFEWRIITFNTKVFADSSLNVKVGHIELPYGLEHVYDSNGTIRNFGLGPKLGLMADWGAGINGTLPEFDYELTLTRGTGNEWHSADDPFAITGRVSTPRENNLSVGLSAFHGEVRAGGVKTRRTKVAADCTWGLGAFALLGEVGGGKVEDDSAVDSMLELDWVSSAETVQAYGRAQSTFIERAGDKRHVHAGYTFYLGHQHGRNPLGDGRLYATAQLAKAADGENPSAIPGL